MIVSVGDNDASSFWWDVLAMAAFEDWQSLTEPILWAQTEIPTMGEEDQRRLAEATLRDLFARDLVFFFRADPDESVTAVRDTPTRRLSDTDVDTILSALHRPGVTSAAGDPNVFFAVTDKGVREANNAPSEIIEFWQGRAW